MRVHRRLEKHHALCADSKTIRIFRRTEYLFGRLPHVLDMKPILRPLSRMRAELASEFLLTIR
jgi:hypothetical protein